MIDVLLCIFVFLILTFVWICLYDTNRFTISQYSFFSDRILIPFKAVVISDLHNKEYGKKNERLLQAIDALEPDVIFIAGDIPTAYPGEDFDVAFHFLSSLSKKYPIYYGDGNHEHRMSLYTDVYGDMGERYNAFLKEQGIHHLLNCSKEVLVNGKKTGVTIYGSQIDRFYYERFGIRPMEETYLSSILGECDARTFSVLVAHNPDYFPQYAGWGPDLVLAGHVHGGVMQIPLIRRGLASPNIRLFPRYDAGPFYLKKKETFSVLQNQRNVLKYSDKKLKAFKVGDSFFRDHTLMLLSRGLGVHTIPFRIFNPGEVIAVSFAPEKGE